MTHLSQIVFPVVHAPVGDQRPFAESVDTGDLVDRPVSDNFAPFLALVDQPGDHTEIVAVPVQQIAVFRFRELGGVEIGQKAVVQLLSDVAVHPVIQFDQFIEPVHIPGHFHFELLILVIQHIGEGVQQGVLAAEVVVEGTLRNPRFRNNIVNGGLVISFLGEQFPGRFNDHFFQASVFSHHSHAFFLYRNAVPELQAPALLSHQLSHICNDSR